MHILIAHGYELVRLGIKHLLVHQSDFGNPTEADNSQDVLDLMQKNELDLIILDMNLPLRGGLEALKEIKKFKPKIPVLILSTDDHFIMRTLKAGASGYLTKENSAAEILQAVRKILSGQKYVTPRLAERLAFELQNGNDKLPHENLSDREYQTLKMLASGKTIKAIAEELALSIKTVSTYRTRLLYKMNMQTNADITLYAIRNHLFDE